MLSLLPPQFQTHPAAVAKKAVVTELIGKSLAPVQKNQIQEFQLDLTEECQNR